MLLRNFAATFLFPEGWFFGRVWRCGAKWPLAVDSVSSVAVSRVGAAPLSIAPSVIGLFMKGHF